PVLEAGGARTLWNESFFSAPQLKRAPLDGANRDRAQLRLHRRFGTPRGRSGADRVWKLTTPRRVGGALSDDSRRCCCAGGLYFGTPPTRLIAKGPCPWSWITEIGRASCRERVE